MSSSQIRQSTSPIKPRHAHARYSSVTYRDAEPNLQAARPFWQCKPRRNGELVSGTPFPDGQKKDSLDATQRSFPFDRRHHNLPSMVAMGRNAEMQHNFPNNCSSEENSLKGAKTKLRFFGEEGHSQGGHLQSCMRVVRKCVQGCGEGGGGGSSDVS